MSRQYLVPFSEQGLVHYANPRFSRPDIEWREPQEFYARLTLEGTERGRSAAYFIWTDQAGRTWPMFIGDMALLLQGAIVAHGVAKGLWIPRKQGTNFGLAYMGPDPWRDIPPQPRILQEASRVR